MPRKRPRTPTQLHARLFHYVAIVTAVHDGDTCTVDIDLGLGIWQRGECVRLNRIDAPELGGATAARGKRAGAYLRKMLVGKKVVLETVKDRREKFGRYLGEIWLEREGEAPLNVSDAMVAAKHAVYRKY